MERANAVAQGNELGGGIFKQGGGSTGQLEDLGLRYAAQGQLGLPGKASVVVCRDDDGLPRLPSIDRSQEERSRLGGNTVPGDSVVPAEQVLGSVYLAKLSYPIRDPHGDEFSTPSPFVRVAYGVIVSVCALTTFPNVAVIVRTKVVVTGAVFIVKFLN